MTSALNDASEVWVISSLLMSGSSCLWLGGGAGNAEVKSVSAGIIILTYRPRAGAARPHLLPMKTIARVLSGGSHGAQAPRSDNPGEARWDAIAADCADWARQASVSWRDAVVLVPFLELLAPARRAFARLGTWMPRIETTRTLAASLGPPTAADGESGFDAALDTVVATQLLGRQRWGEEWMRRDRRGFEHAAGRVAMTAR